eukprot:33376_1
MSSYLMWLVTCFLSTGCIVIHHTLDLHPVTLLSRHQPLLEQCEHNEHAVEQTAYIVWLLIGCIYSNPYESKQYLTFAYIICSLPFVWNNMQFFYQFKSQMQCVDPSWFIFDATLHICGIIAIIGACYTFYHRQWTQRLWIYLHWTIGLSMSIYCIVLYIMHHSMPQYTVLSMDYIVIAAIYPSLVLVSLFGFHSSRDVVQYTKSLTAFNPVVFKFGLPWLNITALQWILLFAWNDVMIEYLGVALINIWCVAGILSSFVLLALRNGTYDQFNRKYPAITPFVLLLCVIISLQIFLESIAPFVFISYIECTYCFWLHEQSHTFNDSNRWVHSLLHGSL